MKAIYKIVGGVAAVAMMFGVAGCRSSKPEANPYTGLMSGRSNVPPAHREASFSSSLPTAAQQPAEEDDFVAPQIGGEDDGLFVAEATPVAIPEEIAPVETVEEAPAARPRRVLPSVPNGDGIVDSAAASGSVYVVKKGDYISKIAKENGVKVSDLKAANPQVTNFDRIVVGQKLNIPAAGKVSSTPAKKTVQTAPVAVEAAPADGIYTVCSGDAISKIAKRFGVKSDDIRRWNDLSSDKLFVGQKLRVKGDAVAVPKTEPAPKKAASVETTAPAEVAPVVTEPATAPANGGEGDEAPVVDDIGGGDALTTSVAPVEEAAAPVGTIFPQILSADDTLESIAGMYDTTVEALLEVNPQIKSNADLKEGDTLMINLNK